MWLWLYTRRRVVLVDRALDRSVGHGTSQSRGPWPFRPPLPDPDRSCEAMGKDSLLRLRLRTRIRRVDGVDGLRE